MVDYWSNRQPRLFLSGVRFIQKYLSQHCIHGLVHRIIQDGDDSVSKWHHLITYHKVDYITQTCARPCHDVTSYRVQFLSGFDSFGYRGNWSQYIWIVLVKYLQVGFESSWNFFSFLLRFMFLRRRVINFDSHLIIIID